ncbi:putative RNA-directed DNA polymerase [Tanacetum coccineum]
MESTDTPDYDTEIDEDNNRDSTTVGTENADETEPITINHSEVANATPNNTNIPDTPSSSVLQEMNDTSQARYPTRSNQGIPKKQYQPDLKAKAKYPIRNYVSHHRLASTHALVVEKLSTVSIPSNVHEVVKNEKWKKAMNEEIEALQKNQTWELVKLPPKKTVGCRWIYIVKLDSKGNIDRYKARLVAKGYTQKYRIDYGDMFAPVVKMNTIRILISIAANQDWPLKQFDVKNAFLNGYLKEEVYLDPPPGVECSGNACRLNKALYGLKQSPRAWFGRFSSFMKKIGYKHSDADHTLFIKNNNNGKVTTLIVYVDDMVVTRNDPGEMKNLQTILATEFELKDLGHLKYFLGIEVARSKSGISMCQRKYVLDLLNETRMLDCKPIETPIETNHKLSILPNQVPTNKERYQDWLERIEITKCVGTRMQIGQEIKRMESPPRVTLYLLGVIWLPKEARNKRWSQGRVPMLNFEEWYMLHCDNQAAVKIANNPVQHDRTKHVEIDRHFIKDHLEKKTVELLYVAAKDQLADMLTKAICGRVFQCSLDKLGMIDIHSPP